MNIVLDSNIVFSALLKTKSTIGEIIFNSEKIYSFSAPDFLRDEIEKHWLKIKKISKLTEDELRESQYHLYKKISFIDERFLPQEEWLHAEELLKDIDIDDIPFLHLQSIWMHFFGQETSL